MTNLVYNSHDIRHNIMCQATSVIRRKYSNMIFNHTARQIRIELFDIYDIGDDKLIAIYVTSQIEKELE